MIGIRDFKGALPKLASRLLPANYATEATDVNVDEGKLVPMRASALSERLSTPRQTIYRHGGEWLNWPTIVNAVPGPVATDRLYLTGDGVPKVRIGGTTYPLRLDRPVARPVAALRKGTEQIQIENRQRSLLNGNSAGPTTSGLFFNITVVGGKATITITHGTGLTPATWKTIIENIRYSASTMVPGVRVVRIAKIRDNGGQQYDAYRNPIGSDARYIDDIVSVIRVGGTALNPTYPAAAAQDGTDEAGVNDPPTITATPLNPTWTTGDAQVALFSGVTISTVEAAQLIVEVQITIDGIASGVFDPANHETLVYAYTYVTVLDEESPPSILSLPINWSGGQSVAITGMSSPPGGRGIDRKRIYRSQTSAGGQTELFLIAEVPAATPTFFDEVDSLPLQEPISTVDFESPPDNLEGLVAMPNGMMAAYVGRELFFCEPYKPHAWPSVYTLTVDKPIMGLAAFGSSLAILTTGNPYVAEGAHPAAMRMDKLDVAYPCIAKRSVVDLGYAVAYASLEGLVVIDNAGARLATEGLFTRRQWRADLNIGTAIASHHEGRYLLSYVVPGGAGERKTVMIDLRDQTPYVLSVSDEATAFFADAEGGATYVLEADGRNINHFDQVFGGLRSYSWASKDFTLPNPVNFGAIRIDAASMGLPSIAVQVWADDILRATITKANSIERLPSGFTARKWKIKIAGNMAVSAVYLAGTPGEIARMEL